MNRVARKGLVTAMVAGGVLASAGYAQADSAAGGESAGSPGVLSGNTVQVPVHVPVNVCGNTVDVVGLLNPAFGNACANTSGSSTAATGTRASSQSSPTSHHSSPLERGSRASSVARPARHAGTPAAETAGARSSGGAHAAGRAAGSPGVLAGNGLQLPLDIPLNVAGNSANVVGVGNPTFGNTAVNSEPPATRTPPPPSHLPIPAPPNEVTTAAAPSTAPTLAHTGADGLGLAGGASAALLLGGTVLYRRARPAARAHSAAAPGRR
jgi:hypothetical protein